MADYESGQPARSSDATNPSNKNDNNSNGTQSIQSLGNSSFGMVDSNGSLNSTTISTTLGKSNNHYLTSSARELKSHDAIRAWDWRKAMAMITQGGAKMVKADHVLRLVRVGVAKEMGRVWSEMWD